MNWIALVLALPTSPSAVRVRVWRALKSSGCGALRDGVYLLPESPDCARVFEGLAQEVRQADGEATLLAFAARDAEQQTDRASTNLSSVTSCVRGANCGQRRNRRVDARCERSRSVSTRCVASIFSPTSAA